MSRELKKKRVFLFIASILAVGITLLAAASHFVREIQLSVSLPDSDPLPVLLPDTDPRPLVEGAIVHTDFGVSFERGELVAWRSDQKHSDYREYLVLQTRSSRVLSHRLGRIARLEIWDDYDYARTETACSAWLLVVLFGFYPLLFLIRDPLRHKLRHRRGTCVACGYDLTGNVSGRCPECGTAIARRGEG